MKQLTRRKLLTSGIASLGLFGLTRKVKAQSVPYLIEGFEWGGNVPTRYKESTDGFNIQSQTVLDGNYSLENDSDISGSNGTMWHKTDTISTPFEVEFYIQTDNAGTSTQNAGWRFGPDSDNHYSFHVEFDADRIQYYRVVNGSAVTTEATSTSEPLEANERYTVNIRIDDGNTFDGDNGEIRVQIKNENNIEIANFSVIDTTYAGDYAYGWYVGNANNARIYFDTLRKIAPVTEADNVADDPQTELSLQTFSTYTPENTALLSGLLLTILYAALKFRSGILYTLFSIDIIVLILNILIGFPIIWLFLTLFVTFIMVVVSSIILFLD